MPTHDFIDIGDVLDYEFVQGTILAIHPKLDTCEVAIGGETLSALMFFHIRPNSVLRSNGAIVGAASEFYDWLSAGFYTYGGTIMVHLVVTIYNPVIVMKKRDNSIVKVIGLVAGLRNVVGDSTAETDDTILNGQQKDVVFGA
jgi:hypothetical protein